MSIDDQQIRAIAFLAKACRPTGARRWDEAGIVAAVAQVRGRSLAEVVMAVIRAASDRDCQTPGVIPSPGSHWAESVSVRPAVVDSVPVGTRCTVCGEPATRHGRDADHGYMRPIHLVPDEWAKHVNDLRAELAPTAGPSDTRTIADVIEDCAETNPGLHAQVENARAAINHEGEV